MPTGKPEADSSVLVTSHVSAKALVQLAKDLFGEAPVFWGRYFTGTSTGGNVEYRHLKENAMLRANGIRVLPIARQTKWVAGDSEDGSADAKANATDILVTFGRLPRIPRRMLLCFSTSRARRACPLSTTQAGRTPSRLTVQR